MNNKLLMWIFLGAVVVTVFIAFNYQGSKKAVPLAEIFPEEEVYPVDVEYEYVNEEPNMVAKEGPKPPAKAVVETVASAPAQVVPAVPQTPAAVSEVKTQAAVAVTTTQIAKVETPKPTIELQAKPVDLSKFTIQVASFQKIDLANDFISKAKLKSYEPLVGVKESAKGTWYRIYVGQFAQKSEADDYLAKVTKDYQDSFVIAPSK